jgi:hypothetical protein
MTVKVKSLLKLLSSDDLLEDLTLEQIITFMRLASHLRREILHTLRPAHPEEVAPESNLLPLNVTQFLAQSMNWTHLMVKRSWDILRDIIWTNGVDLETCPIQQPDRQDLISFEEYGHPLFLGLSIPRRSDSFSCVLT